MMSVTSGMKFGGVALRMKRIRRPDGGSLMRGLLSARARQRAKTINRSLGVKRTLAPVEPVVPAE